MAPLARPWRTVSATTAVVVVAFLAALLAAVPAEGVVLLRAGVGVGAEEAGDGFPYVPCTPNPKVRIVASLASMGSPARLVFLKRALESIRNQTLQPNSIIVTFPDRLKRLNVDVTLPTRDIVMWKRLVRPIPLTAQQLADYGPGSKLLGALHVEKDPDTVVVTLDDDVAYHPGVIEALACKLQRSKEVFKQDVAAAFAGQKSCREVAGSRYVRSQGGPFPGFAMGFAGAAYRVRYFDDLVWKIADNRTVPEGCFHNDDVFISGAMFRASGVHPSLVSPGFKSVVWHGDCYGERCGFTSDSSRLDNIDMMRKGVNYKKDCEKFFDRFCDPKPSGSKK